MADEATTARRLAINFEGIKYAFRQSKEGIVISFVVHPQQVPDGLAVAALGTRYIVALVELGDDETARPPKRKEVTTKPRPDSTALATGGARSWHEMSPAQQAGLLCNDPAFQKFLRETERDAWQISNGDAPSIVRNHCLVKSRGEILSGTTAERAWKELVSDYRAWMREPEVV